MRFVGAVIALIFTTWVTAAQATVLESDAGSIIGSDVYGVSPYLPIKLATNTSPFDFGSLSGPYGIFSSDEPTYLITYTTTGAILGAYAQSTYLGLGSAWYIDSGVYTHDYNPFYDIQGSYEFNDPTLYSISPHSISWLYTPATYKIYTDLGLGYSGPEIHAAEAIYTPSSVDIFITLSDSTPQRYSFTLSTFSTAVPEPPTWLIMGLGSLAVGIALRCRKQRVGADETLA